MVGDNMDTIGIVTLASVFNKNRAENEQIIRDAIQYAVSQVGIYPLIESSLHKEPIKAAA